jgi:DNA polymerase III subunit gamma/tau
MTGDAPSPGQDPGPAARPRQAAPAAPLALYRRYRPASFAEVKGQDHVTEPLRQALRSGRINHAYLFSGPRGCGKTSSARILARSLNCEQGPTPDPCGVCASCVALAPAGPGSIDVIEIDAASHGGVDDARDLRERAFYAPVAGRFKIYIIDEAHMVTREGFNALLKLVEEPPPHLKFVFATTEPEKVIATIRSRTHHYPFRLVPPAVLRELLEQILAAEGVAYEPAVIPVVIRAGAGSVRDSLSVLDQLIAGSDDSGLSYARAVALLGFTDDRLLDEVAEAFAARDGAAVFGAIDRVVEGGHDPRRFATDLLDRLRDLIVLAAVPDAASTGLLDIPADRLDGMRAQAAGFGQAELTGAAEIISAGLIEMRGATSPRLLLELMCAQVLLPAPGTGDSDLRSRLERLERRLESAVSPDGAAGLSAPARPAVVPPPAAPTAARQEPPRQEAPRQDPGAAGRPQDAGSAAWPAVAQPPGSRPAAAAESQGANGRRESRGSGEAGGSGRAGAGGGSDKAPAPPSQPPDARPVPGAGPARDSWGDSASRPAEPASTAGSQQAAGPADAGLLQSRWPDILEAVRGKRKVAWILLTNATVQSLADGILTIEFAREGDAKGFVSSGCDRLLGEILQAMFGISPQLKATARTPGSGPGGARGVAGPGAPGGAGGPGHAGGHSSTGSMGGVPAPGGSADPGRPAGPGGSGPESGPGARPTGNAPQAGWDDPPPPVEEPGESWDDDPRDDDSEDIAGSPPQVPQQNSRAGSRPVPPAAQAMTGMDLIERELGGRVIEDFGGT